MGHEILIDLSKLVDNFEDVYEKAQDSGVVIRVVHKGKILQLTRPPQKTKKRAVKRK